MPSRKEVKKRVKTNQNPLSKRLLQTEFKTTFKEKNAFDTFESLNGWNRWHGIKTATLGHVSNARLVHGLQKRIFSLERDVRDLQAVNELLRRAQKEAENPKVQLLKTLRLPTAEAALLLIKERQKVAANEFVTDASRLQLLSVLSERRFIEIENGTIQVTEPGLVFLKNLFPT